MTIKYKKVKDPMTDEVSCVRRWDDADDTVPRSEERRVGKEGRSRWSP